MNIITTVERRAKGAVPTYIPRAIFRPSVRQTNEMHSPARVSERLANQL